MDTELRLRHQAAREAAKVAEAVPARRVVVLRDAASMMRLQANNHHHDTVERQTYRAIAERLEFDALEIEEKHK